MNNQTPYTWPSPLADEAYHGLAGEIVKKIEPHTEADPAALLVQFLVAFGNCAGRNAYAQVEGGRHYPAENAVLVGDTAKGRKGTSWSQIYRLFSEASPAWTERIVEGLSSGEGLIWGVRDKIVQRQPVKSKGRVIDYEEVEVDPGVADKRLMVQEGEFAQPLKVTQREGNTLSPVVRRAWDCGEILQSLTKTNQAKATKAHVSIVGHITQFELITLLSESDTANGLANRFLWVCTRRSKCLPEGGRIDGEDFSDEVLRLVDAIEYAQADRLIARDAGARALWAEVYPNLSEGLPGKLGMVTSRAEAHVLRLSMIYALLDLSPWVRPEHLRAALEVWRYAEDSARFIFGRGDNAKGSRQPLIDLIRRQGSIITARELQQKSRRYHTAEDALTALQDLADAAYGELRYEGGRAVPTFYLADAPTDDADPSTVYASPVFQLENTTSVDVDTPKDEKSEVQL